MHFHVPAEFFLVGIKAFHRPLMDSIKFLPARHAARQSIYTFILECRAPRFRIQPLFLKDLDDFALLFMRQDVNSHVDLKQLLHQTSGRERRMVVIELLALKSSDILIQTHELPSGR